MIYNFESQRQASGLHVACVMDGNGRWATRRGLPRPAGHRAGAEAVRRVVEAAPALGVTTLTLYAFAQANWTRPAPEVSAILTLLGTTLRAETVRLKRAGVRLQVIGRRDRLPGAVRTALCRAEWETRAGTCLHLRVAVDYSSRWALREAAGRLGPGASTEATFEAALAASLHPDGSPAPPVDLLVRTGGEHRLSDFLLWEAAHAELLFLDVAWPDVTGATLAAALDDFHQRERRFGGLVTA